MAVGDLVTLSVALSYLGISTDPGGIVAAIISGISTTIQNWVGYPFALASYTRTFNGTGSDRLLLPDRPVLSVNSVTVDTISIPLSVPPAPGFLFDSRFVYITPGTFVINSRGSVHRFSKGIQNVIVSYNAGFVTVPADIAMACLMWIASIDQEVGQDVNVKMLRAGDTQIDYGNALTKIGDLTVTMPPQVAAVLLPYRRVAAA